ncbi:MAG: 26S protease regulatory subunit [DPANN group archaeon]|nr:26S protease regulatory subunit [DPANN group archaeon]
MKLQKADNMSEHEQFLKLARNFFLSYVNNLNAKDLESGESLAKRALGLGASPREIKLLYLDVAQGLHDKSSSRDDRYYAAGLDFVRKTDYVRSAKSGLKEIVEEDLPPFVSIEQPDIDFSAVIGLEQVKREIRRVVVDPFNNPEKWRKYFSSDEAKEGVILTGPPGCGKTLLMRAAAGEGCATFIYLKGEEVPQGKEAESVEYVFNLAKKYSPSIVFIDECQAVLNPRRTRFVTAMQKELDGFGKIQEHILVVGNTNKPWDIDTTLRRSGRLGTLIFVQPPGLEERIEIFKQKLSQKPVSADINYNLLGEKTDSHSASDIADICKQASKVPYDQSRDIFMSDLEQAISGRKSSVVEWFSIAKAQIEKSDDRKEVFSDLLAEVTKYMSSRDIKAV